jgi:hypothetical protein
MKEKLHERIESEPDLDIKREISKGNSVYSECVQLVG